MKLDDAALDGEPVRDGREGDFGHLGDNRRAVGHQHEGALAAAGRQHDERGAREREVLEVDQRVGFQTLEEAVLPDRVEAFGMTPELAGGDGKVRGPRQQTVTFLQISAVGAKGHLSSFVGWRGARRLNGRAQSAVLQASNARSVSAAHRGRGAALHPRGVDRRAGLGRRVGTTRRRGLGEANHAHVI